MLIGGKRVDAVSGKTFESENPYTREPWATVPDGSAADVDLAVQAARDALNGEWGSMTGFTRARLLRKLGDLIEVHAERLGRMEVNDSGKLYLETVGQAKGLSAWYHYFAGLADKVEGRQIPGPTSDFLIYTRREPVGVVAAITPWNSPLLLLSVKLAPALAAGCTVVVKPSEHSPTATLAFAELFEEAGFPPGVLNVVTGISRETGAALAAHPGVDRVGFTGSTETGRSVAKAAAGNLNKATLELGGKSPQVVFPDADLDAAANGIVAGVFAASGQSCIAGTRLIAHVDIHDELVERIVEKARRIRQGDPHDVNSQMGPMANKVQYEKVMHYLGIAKDEGATAACGGGQNPELGGYFIEPTLLTGVTKDSTVVREEVFGPVLAALTFTDEDEAVALANDTEFGLGGGVWTNDIGRAHRVAARIQAGTVWVNTYRLFAPSAPFGGVKQSGIGRENGIHAIDEYTEEKTIWVNVSGVNRDPFAFVAPKVEAKAQG